ncbi:exodeoxyribonuclease III [Dongshaea marina]|uniref:exodeoxyribonuclease III n=1 Tax=Dongshaea marina TaxID=2047966 RepID=UPI000D3EBE1C|nr:exodeoxyribonuclease III [Dongshaea marina]
MKIVSFNINGLRARLHQLQALIDKHKPDVIGLQEIKVHDEQFPLDAIKEMGYHVVFHGQKAHYGVALLSLAEPQQVQKGFPTDDEDAQRRMIMASYPDENGKLIRVLNGYFPQGENREHEVKFPAKRKFYEDLNRYLAEHQQADEPLVVMGDINVSPTDLDIGIGDNNKKRWLKTGKCSFLPEEREWLDTLQSWGLTDSFRHLHPEQTEQYSWFDYRSRGFDDNRGLRIDVILATSPLVDRIEESGIDYELRGIEKPSDHAPIWTSFKA